MTQQDCVVCFSLEAATTARHTNAVDDSAKLRFAAVFLKAKAGYGI